MARWEGIEPPTSWFVARHSIELSYQRAKKAYYHDAGVPRQLGITSFWLLLEINRYMRNITRIENFRYFCNK